MLSWSPVADPAKSGCVGELWPAGPLVPRQGPPRLERRDPAHEPPARTYCRGPPPTLRDPTRKRRRPPPGRVTRLISDNSRHRVTHEDGRRVGAMRNVEACHFGTADPRPSLHGRRVSRKPGTDRLDEGTVMDRWRTPASGNPEELDSVRAVSAPGPHANVQDVLTELLMPAKTENCSARGTEKRTHETGCSSAAETANATSRPYGCGEMTTAAYFTSEKGSASRTGSNR